MPTPQNNVPHPGGPAPTAPPGAPGAQQPQFYGAPNRHIAGHAGMPAQIQASQLIKEHRPKPEMGWRGLIAKGGVNLGVSRAERDWNLLLERVRANLRSTNTTAIMGTKGGPGKTTTTMLLGMALAKYRATQVVAIDANPDDGNLNERVATQKQTTYRDLLADPSITRINDIVAYAGTNNKGLWILGGVKSTESDYEITADEFREVLRRTQVGFQLALVDCGTGLRHQVVPAILEQTDSVVVAATARIDAARAADATLFWLHQHGYDYLGRAATVVINEVKGKPGDRELTKLRNHFEQKVTGGVHVLPYDEHLAEAGPIDWDRLQPRTQRVAIEIAASVADGFARAGDKDHRQGWGQQQ
ncbi:MinD/ParA family ATP-binding protein [Mycobacteroides chelonae]|uniref:MinD/ParA family ATP-binding protein n=1 Tax=Mycobacteroides chelonae TaxID=1774 RepID=UPI0012FF670A|nr:AAA family ATPase [Mycobacteroides chelonae]